jgi:hypothetical protein
MLQATRDLLDELDRELPSFGLPGFGIKPCSDGQNDNNKTVSQNADEEENAR